SKEFVFNQFESNTRGETIVGPGAGAAIVEIPNRDKAIAITTDSNSRYIYLDPEIGGKIAVAEAMRNIVASGAKPLGITDGINYGNPTNEEVFWQMEKSIEGISEACRVLDVPVISGNVSMYNQSYGEPIYPTPIIGMVGLLESKKHVTPNAFQQAGDVIYLIGETKAEFGGSELQRLVDGDYSGKAPEINLQLEKEQQAILLDAIRKGIIQSAEDLAEGGLVVALAESVIRSDDLGANVTLENDATVALFSESQSRFIVTVRAEDADQFESLGLNAKKIGTVSSENQLTVIDANNEKIINESVSQLATVWKNSIANSFETN